MRCQPGHPVWIRAAGGPEFGDDAQSGIPPVHATARWAEQQRGVAVLAAETSPQRSLIIGTVISTALVR